MANLDLLADVIIWKILAYLPFQSQLLLRLVNKNLRRKIRIEDQGINKRLYNAAWYEYKRLHLDAFRNRIMLADLSKKMSFIIFESFILFKENYFDEWYNTVEKQQNHLFDSDKFPLHFAHPRSMMTTDMKLNRMARITAHPFKTHCPILIKSRTNERCVRVIPKLFRRRPLDRETILVCALDIYRWHLGNTSYVNSRIRELDNSSICMIGYGQAIVELLHRHNYEIELNRTEVCHLDWYHFDQHLNKRIVEHEKYDISEFPKAFEITMPDSFPQEWIGSEFREIE